MQFNTDTVYKLKDMSSTLITIVNQNNDEISTKVYNSKVGKFFHFKDIDGQYITVHFNKDSYSRLPILHFEEVSSEDVIQTFLNDPDLGINVESAEEFKYDIEQILKETTDNNIMADDFQVDQLITWARGKKFTKTHVKELIDSAFKRGQEQASIVGERTKVGGARPLSQETFSYNLTDSEKERALVRFGTETKWSDSKKFAEYEKIKSNDF